MYTLLYNSYSVYENAEGTERNPAALRTAKGAAPRLIPSGDKETTVSMLIRRAVDEFLAKRVFRIPSTRQMRKSK